MTQNISSHFDPTRLRVPDLRRILIFHDVDFPSLARKAQLVSLFFDNITPKAKVILEQKRRVRPSSEGIEIIMDETRDVQPQIYLPEVSE